MLDCPIDSLDLTGIPNNQLNYENEEPSKVILNARELLTSNGRRISFDHFISDATAFPSFVSHPSLVTLQRVSICTQPLLPTSPNASALLVIPPNNNDIHNLHAIFLVQHGLSSHTCPENYYQLHLTTTADATLSDVELSAILQHCIDHLRRISPANSLEELAFITSVSPLLDFNRLDHGSTSLPSNVYLCGETNSELHFESHVFQAQAIFQQICGKNIPLFSDTFDEQLKEIDREELDSLDSALKCIASVASEASLGGAANEK